MRSKLEKINESISKLNNSIDKMVDEIATLQATGSDLVTLIIEEENLLKDSIWNIRHRHHGIFLDYAGSYDDSILKSFTKLCNDSSNAWIDMENGIQLRIDEDYVSFYFDESKMLLPFANKHKMKLIGNNLTSELQALKREYSALEKLIHQFSIKD